MSAHTHLPLAIALMAAWHVSGVCQAWASARVDQVDVLPRPKQVTLRPGRLVLSPTASAVVAGPDAGYAAEAISKKLSLRIVPAAKPGVAAVTLRIEADAPFARRLARDARPEAYRLEIGPQGVDLIAAESEGLLRGAATLAQLVRVEAGAASLPQLTIVDWPNFRYRCAADWLLNAEVNRWAYDWGDGHAACLARIKRKLDMCFAYKINQVWFDGFGWDLGRSPGYAEFARECSRYARGRGIRLTFAGYGGGYGTAYQQSEIYRCGFFGQPLVNRRPYPDGVEYLCRGMGKVEASRRYGTCLSNEGLARAKIDEMQRFVAAVEPSFMYIHDIDTGTFAESQASWRFRCEECRRRWPSDELADERGQAGALAAWYRQIRTALNGASSAAGYRPAKDLTLIFTSPLYTCYYEQGPAELWERETEYFCLLSRLMGPAEHVQFGLREQFYRPLGGTKIAHLRQAMDRCGGRSAVHVIAFGGGDSYLSDDLANCSGAMAHFYEGAESVCLSNGGVHEEPVQLLNAEILWSGSAAGYRESPPDERSAEDVFRRMAKGQYRPAAIFAPDRIFHRICRRLWGDAAGTEMYHAYQAADESGDGPLGHVWWGVTTDLARLRAKSPPGFDWNRRHASWVRRKAVTEEALTHARRASRLTDDEDLRWFTTCLAVGSRFADCMALTIDLRLRDSAETRTQLAGVLRALESQIAASNRGEKTDPLGGDPGCWRESLDLLRRINGL